MKLNYVTGTVNPDVLGIVFNIIIIKNYTDPVKKSLIIGVHAKLACIYNRVYRF